MRLPVGYAALDPDLGAILRARRRSERIKQEALARDVGVSRATLSRVERGRTPAPATLDAVMAALGLDWDEVAVRGRGPSPARRFEDSFRGDVLVELGRGGVLADHPDDAGLLAGDRRVVLTHPLLAELAGEG
jgi:transcriptional regulator with XRE-family HTH domain